MTKQVQFRKGTTAEYTLTSLEYKMRLPLTQTKTQAVVHDGATPGGFELAKAKMDICKWKLYCWYEPEVYG